MLPHKTLLSVVTAILFVVLSLCACGRQNTDESAELTAEEETMAEAGYYSTDFVAVPDEIIDAMSLGSAAPEKAIAFDDINQLTKPGYLEMENGYALLENGTAYVAVKTDFPGANRDMIHWWFWWHALKDVRYKIWCPGDHYGISVEDIARYSDESVSMAARYLDNPHYPVEDIGAGVMPLSIRFVSPESFGFDTSVFKKNGIEAVVCGVVGFRLANMTLEHTYICHIFRKKDDGLELRSRFWLGKKLDMPRITKLVVNENLALDMMLHCAKEFNHLAEFLPEIYSEFAGLGNP